MGQYHMIVNVSKQEFLSPRTFTDGSKLMEFGSSGGGTMLALAWLLKNDWNGDYITIVGDYGDPTDYDHELLKDFDLDLGNSSFYNILSSIEDGVPDKRYFTKDFSIDTEADRATIDQAALATASKFTDVSKLTIAKIEAAGDAFIGNKYGYDRFEKIFKKDRSFYAILNEDTAEYLDPRAFGDSAVFMSFADGHSGGVMTALAVLLASACKGGARGGGDFSAYGAKDEDLVGSWADKRISIVPRASVKHFTDISPRMRDLLEADGCTKYEVSGSSVTRVPTY